MKIISLYKKAVAIALVVMLASGVLPFAVFAEDTEDTSEKIVEITYDSFPDRNVYSNAVSFDINKDGWLSQREIDSAETLWLGMTVKDCTGIEYFTELKELRVSSARDLEKIDVSKNTKLETLIIGLTKIAEIDLSHNTALSYLSLSNNNLTSLDLSNNTALEYLDCSGNQISDLVIDKCLNLKKIDCSKNNISGSYDLRNMTELESVRFTENGNVRISVNGLKRLEYIGLGDTGLSSLRIADCPNLKEIYCPDNKLTSLSIENCPIITRLELKNNFLESLDGVKTYTVEYLNVENNKLTSLDTSQFSNLFFLFCNDNDISSLNFDNNGYLSDVECKNNKLTSLKIIDKNRELKNVICSNNPIETLELSGGRLNNVVCENAKLSSIEKIEAPNLLSLNVNNNRFTYIDISAYPNLIDLFCNDNQITKIDVSKNGDNCKKFWRLYCENNNLTAIDAENNEHLSYTYSTDNYCIHARGNSFKIEPDENGRYDLSKLTEVSGFDVSRTSNWVGGTVDGNILTVAPGAKEVTYTYLMKEKNINGDPVAETFTLLLPKNECKHAHTSVVGAKAATCKNKGYTGNTVCNDCKEIIASGTEIAVNPNNHKGKTSVINKKNATCTAKGYTGDTKCSDCGAVLKKGAYIAAKGHSFKTVVTKATLTKNGSTITKCTTCQAVKAKSTIAKIASVKLSKTSFTYNGKTQKPTVTVKDSKGNKLKNGTDYTVKYSSGCKNVGQYSVTITFKGNYAGTKTLTFKIVPKGTSISKLTAGKKQFTAKWSAQTAQTTGYELQYSTKSSMSGAKTVTVGKNKTTSAKVKKLKGKKKYYARVRTYKLVKINGKNVKLYSSWSKVKSVKTK